MSNAFYNSLIFPSVKAFFIAVREWEAFCALFNVLFSFPVLPRTYQ